jgi:hypothetical protein
MAVLEALVVVLLAGVLVYGVVSGLVKATGGHDPRELAPRPGRWRSAHYDDRGLTRVVLQKLSTDGIKVLDEHTIATIRADDPDYDDKFLSAMLTARQRQALFESEEE